MRHLLVVSFALMVALAPLPLGSNRDWAWSPLAAVAGILLIAVATLAYHNRDWQRRIFVRFDALIVPGILFGLVVAWGVVQLSGWTPKQWATSISAASTLGLAETHPAITVDIPQQWTALMRLLTYAAVFGLAAVLGSSAPAARRILGAIVVVATSMTLYSMAAEAINSQSRITGFSLWVVADEFFTGSFVNSNNYATYAGISALAALVLAFRPVARQSERETASERWRRRLASMSGVSGLWLALSLILCMGVVLSGSRAGAMSLTLGLIVLAAFYVRGPVRIVVVLMILVVMVAVVLVIPSGDRLVVRMAKLISHGESGRETLFPMALDAIALRPWTGWGMNSFGDLYSLFQPPSLVEYFDKIHNTYLELAFDLGVPAALMLVLAVGWIAAQCAAGFFTRRRDRELAGLGVFATALVGFHALFDFSLQIPAVACCYFAMLGIAWAQSWSSQSGNSQYPDH
jgi:O-antigen ligase